MARPHSAGRGPAGLGGDLQLPVRPPDRGGRAEADQAGVDAGQHLQQVPAPGPDQGGPTPLRRRQVGVELLRDVVGDQVGRRRPDEVLHVGVRREQAAAQRGQHPAAVLVQEHQPPLALQARPAELGVGLQHDLPDPAPVLPLVGGVGRRRGLAAADPVVERRVRQHRDDLGVRRDIQGEEDVLPQHPAALGEPDAVLQQEGPPEQLVRVGRDQWVDVGAVDCVVQVRRVDLEGPLGLVGAGLLAVQDVGPGPRRHSVPRLERLRVELVVVVHEQARTRPAPAPDRRCGDGSASPSSRSVRSGRCCACRGCAAVAPRSGPANRRRRR